MYLSHPLRITLCQIVVDRDDMHALSFQGIQICRQGRNQSLSFTCLHLSNTSLVQDDTTDQLHTEMFHAKHTARCFTHGRKRLRQKIIQCLAICQTLFVFICLGTQFLVAQCDHILSHPLDLVHNRIDAL